MKHKSNKADGQEALQKHPAVHCILHVSGIQLGDFTPLSNVKGFATYKLSQLHNMWLSMRKYVLWNLPIWVKPGFKRVSNGFKLRKPGFQRVSKVFPKGFWRVCKGFLKGFWSVFKGFQTSETGFLKSFQRVFKSICSRFKKSYQRVFYCF